MMMTYGNQYSVAALFDGGWRSADRDALMSEYDLTEIEAIEICEALKEMEEN